MCDRRGLQRTPCRTHPFPRRSEFAAIYPRAVLAAALLVFAACSEGSPVGPPLGEVPDNIPPGDKPVPLPPTEPGALAGAWRMASFEGVTVPGAYAVFPNQPVDDHIVGRVEIRVDSAMMAISGDRYQRRYCFTELHDEAPMYKYWITRPPRRAVAPGSEARDGLEAPLTRNTPSGQKSPALVEGSTLDSRRYVDA